MITKVFLVLGLAALNHQQDPYYYKYATYNQFRLKDPFTPTGKQ